MFAVCFVGSTCAIASNFFTQVRRQSIGCLLDVLPSICTLSLCIDHARLQVDSTHWVLDVSAAVSEQFYTLNDVSLFLVAPNSLPPEAALSLYVSVGANTAWAYRGHVSNSRPSEVMPCLWPEPGDASPAGVAHAQLGVALEPLAAAAAKRGSKVVEKEDFCKRVGMDLFQVGAQQ